MDNELLNLLNEELMETKWLTHLAQQRLELQREELNNHKKEFDRHSAMLDRHSIILDKHSVKLDKHGKAFDLVLNRMEKMNEKLDIELDRLRNGQ